MGKPAYRAVLLRCQSRGCPDYREKIVRAPDRRVGLEPVVATEGAAARIQGTLHHFLHEAWIGRIDPICLTTPDGAIQRPIGHVLPSGDQDTVDCSTNLRGRWVFPDDAGTVGVGNVVITSARAE